MKRKIPRWCKNAKITMIENDLTTGDLAKALGFTREYMSSILNGRAITEPAVKKVSDYLNISSHYEY